MTCVVGVASETGVILGADSLASANGFKQTCNTSKLIKIEGLKQVDDYSAEKLPFAIGYTQSFRMGNILEHNFIPPVLQKDEDLLEYMINAFVPEVIKVFDEHHFTEHQNGVKQGGNFLVGVSSRVFEVQTDFSILEAGDGLFAIGSGREIALGSLYTSAALGADPEQAVILAIKSASEYCMSVGGNINILKI